MGGGVHLNNLPGPVRLAALAWFAGGLLALAIAALIRRRKR